MKRTQLYIDETLFDWLSALSHRRKTTISDLVRKAVQRVYGRPRAVAERLKALQAVCGIWENRPDLPSTEEYVRSLRKSTRLKRFGVA